jgi:serine/threonine protein kinase
MMNELVTDLLAAGGVFLTLSDDPMSILDSWLGVSGAEDFEGEEMMEDSAPFEPALYRALESLLISAWRPKESGMIHSNVLLERNCEPQDISLFMCMESVRVTRSLRYWLELNVVGSNTMAMDTDENDHDKSLSHLLLECCSTENPLEERGQLRIPLIHALYYHIEDLPRLQSQIHLYTQSLMRGEGTGHAIANPQSRLAHYQMAQQVAAKLNQEWQDHVDRLEYILGEWYCVGPTKVRRQCRAHLGSVWSQFVSRSGGASGIRLENTSSSGIKITLRVLYRILQGTERLEKAHEHLLTYHLVPLHRPSSMVLWRDQTSLLELYHEPLVQCIAIILQKQPMWILKVVASLLEPDVWPKGGNTPKLVLLLHEIDTYIGLIPNPIEPMSFGDTLRPLLLTLGRCMSSDHSGLAERALAFFKNKKFEALVELNFEQTLSVLMPFLVRREPAWNPTVRKMTYTVLKKFKDFDEARFMRMCEKIFPDDEPIEDQPSPEKPAKTKGTIKLGTDDAKEVVHPKDLTLKAGMAGWKPPSASTQSTPGAMMPPPSSRGPPRGAPPLTVTGVAPWAMNRQGSQPQVRQNKNPPLTVTGVAPWAMQQQPQTASAKRRAGEALGGLKEAESTNPTEKTLEMSEGGVPKPRRSRVLAYIDQIKPPAEEEGASSWAKDQMAETPTFLPNLKFHDLVFGHDLGEGAFGVVKYARLIDRGRTRSQWPEYAVKVISTEKIKELGYEASVQRELAVLRILSHPGIARLVSSFRFREGVYLVLEYASCGDLYTLLHKNGSLDHDSTRFVIGEVVAALSSLHEIGLVYGDLKPENVVILESGHVKLTDFGGCRPITAEAKFLVASSAKNLLKQLRDGDWKPQPKQKKNAGGKMDVAEEEQENDESDGEYDAQDDHRIEGTTAYLPPEVVMGTVPTLAADSWALGCVLYQCLSGRPPILEDDETLTRHRIVAFHHEESTSGGRDLLFQDSHAAGIEPDAKDLIQQLLKRNAPERPGVAQIAQHDFFLKAGIDVFQLYRSVAHPLDVGDVSPVADAKWSRRQFSSIWSPQPQAYDISLPTDDVPCGPRGISSSGPIPEGEEAAAFFSRASSHPNNLRHISEKIPLPS